MVMFIILAVFILGSALVCVTTKRIMRAATFLLFVLFGVAGLYFLLLGCSSDICVCRRCNHYLYFCNSACQQTYPSGLIRKIAWKTCDMRRIAFYSRVCYGCCRFIKEQVHIYGCAIARHGNTYGPDRSYSNGSRQVSVCTSV